MNLTQIIEKAEGEFEALEGIPFKAEVELHECGHRIGSSDKSVSTCLNCNKEI